VASPTVMNADEVDKARLRAAKETGVAEEAHARTEKIDAGTRYLVKTIPRLLARLEELDYPGADLVSVLAPGPRRLFRRRQAPPIERAAWLLWEYRYSEGQSALYLLSDGHLKASGWSSQTAWSSGPIDVSRIPIDYAEERAVAVLAHATSGVEKLLARHGAARRS
jgi:hypothetical protein